MIEQRNGQRLSAQILVQLSDALKRAMDFVFCKKLLHDQKFREMIVTSLMEIGQLANFPGAAADVDQRAIALLRRTVFRCGGGNRLAGRLQSRFDFA